MADFKIELLLGLNIVSFRPLLSKSLIFFQHELITIIPIHKFT